MAPLAPPSPATNPARALLTALTSLATHTIKHALLIALAMALALAILAIITSLHVAPWRGWAWAITNLLAAASLVTIASLILGVPLAINLAAARTVERHQIATQLLNAATGSDSTRPPDAPALHRSLADELSKLESQLTPTPRRLWHRPRAWLIRRSLHWLLADLIPILERTPLNPNASAADWLRLTGPMIDQTLAASARRTALRLALLWGCVAIAAISATIALTHWP